MAKTDRFNIRTSPELGKAFRAAAEARGETQNEAFERLMKAEVEGVRHDDVQPAKLPDSEQLDRIEYNMDALRRAIEALAQRQEVSMAAQVSIMREVQLVGKQVEGVKSLHDSDSPDVPALPAPEEKPLPPLRIIPAKKHRSAPAYGRTTNKAATIRLYV